MCAREMGGRIARIDGGGFPKGAEGGIEDKTGGLPVETDT